MIQGRVNLWMGILLATSFAALYSFASEYDNFTNETSVDLDALSRACCAGGGGGVTTCTVELTNTVTIPPVAVNTSDSLVSTVTFTSLSIAGSLFSNGTTCVLNGEIDQASVNSDLTSVYFDDIYDYHVLCGNKSIFINLGNALTITTTDAAVGDAFGSAVAMSADGSIIVASAPHKQPGNIGCVYIYRRTYSAGTTWTSVQEIVDPNATVGGQFGRAVAVNYDGTNIAIYSNNALGTSSFVTLYVYDSGTDTWVQGQTFTFAVPVNAGNQSLSFSATGSYLAFVDGSATPIISIYQREDTCVSAGTTWQLQQTIVTSSPSTGTNNSIVLSPDGTYVAVGIPFAAGGFGAVEIYQRSGIVWSLYQSISAPVGAAVFGWSTTFSGNGQYLLVGAPTAAPNGFVYQYALRGPLWVLETTLSPSVGSPNYGYQVSVSADGTAALIGQAVSTGFVSGAMRSPDNTWTQPLSFVGTVNSALGTSVSISADGSFGVMGAPNTAGTTAGNIIILRPNGAIIPADLAVSGPLCVNQSMTVNGDVFIAGGGVNLNGTVIAGGVVPCTVSDAAEKENITPISPQEAIEKIRQLRPVVFQWINPHEHNNDTGDQYGFVAQEFAQVFPGLIMKMPAMTFPEQSYGNDATLLHGEKKELLLIALKPAFFAYLVAALKAVEQRHKEIDALYEARKHA